MKVLFLFYQNVVIPSTLITGLIVAFTFEASASGLMMAFLAKVITSGLVGLFIHIFQEDRYFFFENIGYTKSMLFAGALTIDLIGFAMALALLQIWA